MTYWQHLKINFAVAGDCCGKVMFYALMGAFHIMHGLFPCKYTDHHYWSFGSK
jgi:hypothetical protein